MRNQPFATKNFVQVLVLGAIKNKIELFERASSNSDCPTVPCYNLVGLDEAWREILNEMNML